MTNLVEKAKRLRQEASKRVDEELARLGTAEQNLADVGEAHRLIQDAAQAIQQKAHDQIAAVVSKCLKAVFDKPYEFKIHFEKKRGRTEARMVFSRAGKEIDPLDGAGGGVVDIASLALRLACIMLRKPRGRKILILDEPFKNVNGEANRERAAALLETLAEEFQCQIIMTTGYDWLHIGKVIHLNSAKT